MSEDPKMQEEALSEKISELFTSSKGQVKFNTHKNRKAFVDKLVKLVLGKAEPIKEPEAAAIQVHNPHKDAVTRINPSKTKSDGFAIMTEAKATLGDEVSQRHNEKKKSANSW